LAYSGAGRPRGDRVVAGRSAGGPAAGPADDRLPELPEVNLLLLKAREPRQPVTDALYAHILEAFEVKIDLQ